MSGPEPPDLLYHFSEDGDIPVFAPHIMNAESRRLTGVDEALVWAIDEASSPLYFFPRDCPRICFWPTPSTTPEDLERWWGARTARMVACIEWDWLARMQQATVFRYTLPGASFKFHGAPGMYTSTKTVEIAAVEPLRDLLEAHRSAGVELRVMPRLTPLLGIWDTTLHASGVRLRNAQDWPNG